MKIAIGSDLHLEFPLSDRARALAFSQEVEVIVLAGDIANGMHSPTVAFDLAECYPSTHVVWVAGNHEHYHRNIDDQTDLYRKSCEEHERVHFLENNFVDIGSFRFIGCSLWSDFSILEEPQQAMYIARRGISDFSLIKTRNGDQFTPQEASNRFRQSCEYLEKTLADCSPEKSVVVTHFPPGMDTRNMNFKIDPITAYFQANVDHIVDKFQPAAWFYGHNHYSSDLYRGQTRLVSNQLGYPSETGRIPQYEPAKIIELERNER